MLHHLAEEIGSFFVELFRKEETWFILFIAGLGGALLLTIPAVNWRQIILNILEFFRLTWWFWFFIILFPIFESTWLYWRQELFKKSLKFILLELRMPREVERSPQAMEQVLAAMNSLRSGPGNLEEKYWDGEITVPFTLEIMSFGGETHFYVRCQQKQRNLVEAAFFSYYPDVEIIETDDYIEKLPKNVWEVHERGLAMLGTELILSKEEIYPIKTYPYFEKEKIGEKEITLDPMSTFLELLAKLKKEEIIGIQISITPAASDWKDKFEDVLKELQTPVTTTIETGDEEGSSRTVPISRSPGQVDVLERVEENLSKPAFETIVRLIHLSPKTIFNDKFVSKALIGAFNQYSALNLNSFRANRVMTTYTQAWAWPHVFTKGRIEYRRDRLIYNYRHREAPPETWMGKLITSHPLNYNFASKKFLMNTEGIATIFHPPTASVLTAPHTKRVESRKAGPPAGLSIFGEEEEIEKFK